MANKNWRLAESLIQMRNELDSLWPLRDRTSDGAIGDAAHASRSSDHNPWIKDKNGQPVVSAIDVDRDIAATINSRELAEFLVKTRDPRVKYLISNGQIVSSYSNNSRKAWQWGKYSGPNAHKEHMHISVVDKQPLYDARTSWRLADFRTEQVAQVEVEPAPPPIPKTEAAAGGTPLLRLGSAGADVRILQALVGGLKIDGDFGPKTKAGVRNFQMLRGLEATGVVDVATWIELRKGKAK